jgi:hypothetical protein
MPGTHSMFTLHVHEWIWLKVMGPILQLLRPFAIPFLEPLDENQADFVYDVIRLCTRFSDRVPVSREPGAGSRCSQSGTDRPQSTRQWMRWRDALCLLSIDTTSRWHYGIGDDIMASVMWRHATMECILYPKALHSIYNATSWAMTGSTYNSRLFGIAKLRFFKFREQE